ncbi:MAG: hypothetical protein H6621_05450 [Halobacteriovoraceae bacterium]|nr:hypothetical protein [Halobacteriovoraceae bacterium]
MEKIKVLVVGLGPIGQAVCKHIFTKDSLEIIGALDIYPELEGRDLGEVCGVNDKNVFVKSKASELPLAEAQVAVITTTSSFRNLVGHIRPFIENGISIVTTCEEASYPWVSFPDISKDLNYMLVSNNCSMLSTGVNPGFLMDYLPNVMSGISESVESVEVHRFQNALKRRLPFQMKIGSGLTEEDFQAKVKAGEIKHMGLKESAWIIAKGMKLKVSRIDELIQPILATQELKTENFNIEKAMVVGIDQTAIGLDSNGMIGVKLHFRASLVEPDDIDRIMISGKPNITTQIEGGVHGDGATIAIVVNSIAGVCEAKPGLKTVLDFAQIRYAN